MVGSEPVRRQSCPKSSKVVQSRPKSSKVVQSRPKSSKSVQSRPILWEVVAEARGSFGESEEAGLHVFTAPAAGGPQL